MGFKKTTGIYLIHDGVMTGTTTVVSAAINMINVDNAGIEIAWTGTPTGTLSVQGSVSAAIDQPSVTVAWNDLTFNPAITQPAGSAGGYLINLNQFPFPYLRFKYVNASGVGVLSVFLFLKDLN